MDRKQLHDEMKRSIGCPELTHEVLDTYLSSGWWERAMLPWEHCGMHFEKIYGPMSRLYLAGGIYKCRYHEKAFYFGLGLEEPFVTDDMVKNGIWLIYTWAD